MSLRSKVVIENNLKPSKFGKPVLSSSLLSSSSSTSELLSDNNTTNNTNNNNNNNDDDDFEEIYENPFEKLKPLPPINIIDNSKEFMQFSNDNIVKNNNNNNQAANNSNRNSSNSKLTNDDGIGKPDVRPSGSNAVMRNNIVNELKMNNSNESNRELNSEGFHDNEAVVISINANNGEDNNLYSNNNNNNKLDKIVLVEPNNIDNRDNVTSNNKININPNDPTIVSSSAAVNKNLNNFNNNHPNDNTDTNFRDVVNNVIKNLDANRYATKKTIAQGMLDIALLTANASQLKYILQIGRQHEFYILMLSLICVSIGLQVIHGVICILLGSSLNINKQRDQKKANVWNNICLILMLFTVAVNAVISAFDMRDNTAGNQSNITRGPANIQSQISGGR